MKNILNNILITLVIIFILLPFNTLAQTLPDHTAYPPFLCQSTPSVLIILDNSKSMLLPANADYFELNPNAPPLSSPDGLSFNINEPYVGYFDPNAVYSYNNAFDLFTKNNTGTVTTEEWMKGNILNWITMRRIDIARKVLVGGKVGVLVDGKVVNTRSGEGQRILIGEEDTPNSYPGAAFIKEALIGEQGFWFGVKDGSLYVVNKTDVTSKQQVFTLGTEFKIQVVVAKDDPGVYDNQGNPLGIIQRMGDKVRFGLELFNVKAVNTVCEGHGDMCPPPENTFQNIDKCMNNPMAGGDGGDSGDGGPGGGAGDVGGAQKGEWVDVDNWRCTVSDGGMIVVPVGSGNKAHIDLIVAWIEFGKSFLRDEAGGHKEGEGGGGGGGVNIAGVGNEMHPKPGDTGWTWTWTWSPLAEALFEGVNYFKQITPAYYNDLSAPNDYLINDYLVNNKLWDPYYYEEIKDFVPCCNTYIILITDGQSTDDRQANLEGGTFRDRDTPIDNDPLPPNNDPAAYPPNVQGRRGPDFLDDVALWAHTYDLRDKEGKDLAGMQKVILYPIFINFSQDQDAERVAMRLLRDTADNGGGKFFEAKDGEELEKVLLLAINDTKRQIKTASGTSLAVTGKPGGGEGTAFYAYFRPSLGPPNEEVNWLGYLHALWIDPEGNLREDSDGDKELVLADDEIIEFSFDIDTKATIIYRYEVDANGNKLPDPDKVSTDSLDGLKSIWEAGKKLAQMDVSKREIYTYLDLNGDRIVANEDEFIKFIDTNALTLKPYLRADDTGLYTAENIINFIRGDDVSITDADGNIIKMRDRTINGEVWRLGDIIYSIPTVVGRPMENIDFIYADADYLEFYNKYRNREAVVYVGANDGMLHAFRAGVYNSGDNPETAEYEYGWYKDDTDDRGKELWAYIPFNLLPHLKWLTDPNYTHIYYVDLKPRVLDAQIFPDDPEHPGGWGTVLIGGTRFGGKKLTINDFDGSGESKTFGPAYFALDITDPETSPKLLWEFTHDELGFAMSYPTVAKIGDNWYVIIGSGPTKYDSTSDQKAGIFMLNLEDGKFITKYGLDESNAFMANPIAVDVDLNIKDEGGSYSIEVIYIGETYKEGADLNGKMIRISKDVNNIWYTSTLFVTDPGQPITTAPAVTTDGDNNLWVYFGTGKYFIPNDKMDKNIQSFYGIKEPCWNGSVFGDSCGNVSKGNLYESTDVVVYEDGDISIGGRFNDLINEVKAKDGWYIDFPGGERSLSKPVIFGGMVLFTTFVPNNTNICSYGGDGYLYALYYETGTAYKESILGTVIEGNENKKRLLNKIFLGPGIPSSVGLHIGKEDSLVGGGGGSGVLDVSCGSAANASGSKVTAFIQGSSGQIAQQTVAPVLGTNSRVISWEEK